MQMYLSQILYFFAVENLSNTEKHKVALTSCCKPVFGFPLVKSFNDAMVMDLKEWSHNKKKLASSRDRPYHKIPLKKSILVLPLKRKN